MIARKFFISGIVQGVGFRYFAQRAAAKHQIKGYVRNLSDGRVEAFAQGPEKDVEAFRDDLATGPIGAEVSKIEELVIDPDPEYKTFRIER
ncbi:MAG TPA: acylphosphatase [Pyrinomonadaceae bacterium]|nr:acylphosphatase [Pyrinomonadaceae bacterium]